MLHGGVARILKSLKVFLKRVYAVFDQTPGHPRLGLGQRTLRD